MKSFCRRPLLFAEKNRGRRRAARLLFTDAQSTPPPPSDRRSSLERESLSAEDTVRTSAQKVGLESDCLALDTLVIVAPDE
jgi:hypothetical protein